MSSTYTGNPTAAQPPSPAPSYGGVAESVLPSDGDALNAASVAQPLKMPADWITFLAQYDMDRRSITPSLLSDVPGLTLANHAGNRRSLFDHNGYLISDTGRFEETWPTASNGTVTAGAFGNWYVDVVGSGHLLRANSATAGSGGMSMVPGATSGDLVKIYSGYQQSGSVGSSHFFFADFSSIAFEWIGGIVINNDHLNVTQGIAANAASGFQAVFFRDQASGFWHTYSFNGALADFTTSVASTATSSHRFRIELHGKDSPYGTAIGNANGAIRYFIDSTLVRTETALNVVPAAGPFGLLAAASCTGGSTNSSSGFIGHVGGGWNHQLSQSIP